MDFATKPRKLLRLLSATDWRRALLSHRVAAGVEHADMLRHLGIVRTVVDIGANRGQFALAARQCFPAARIYSFEPLPRPAKIYRALFAGDERASIVAAAIGPRSGKALMHVSQREDSSSLLPITEAQNTTFPGTMEASTMHIDVLPLAECLDPKDIEMPALLKLDVQGYEMQVLAACATLLHKFAWVYFEGSFMELYEGQSLADEVIAWLRERGFKLCGIYNVARDKQGRAVQADFLLGE